MKEGGSERQAGQAVITSVANDLVCGLCACLISPGPSDTDNKAH